MAIDIVCFTDRGFLLGKRLRGLLNSKPGGNATLTRCGKGGPSLAEWTAARFPGAEALVFIGAAGIAVRAIAGGLRGKLHDPAVVVVDDQARYAISLLSGHIGGGNDLARRIAALLDAVPVITTATDGAGVFAVDTWAKNHGLAIANPGRIKTVSSLLLSGDPVRFSSPFPVATPPAGLHPTRSGGDAHLVIDIRSPENPDALWLIPPIVLLGLGCRRGTTATAIEAAVSLFLHEQGVAPKALAAVCSIELKQDEAGIVDFSLARRIPFETYSVAELAQAEGEFASSAIVETTAGIASVCDRAVVAGGGTLLVGKTIVDGMALALGVLPYTIPFPSDEEY